MADDSLSALYVHVPFCVRKCGYCGFYSEAVGRNDPRIAQYVGLVGEVIDCLSTAGVTDAVETVYIGGGTPSIASSHLPALVKSILRVCPKVSELTVESNPDSLDDSLVEGLVGAGVTRVSLGVQSFSDEELCALGRAHSSERAFAAARSVKNSGLDLSCDLMCGIPCQSMDTWLDSLNRAVESGIDHISCYPLSIEEGTKFDAQVLAGRMVPPDSDLQADMLQAASSLLSSNGFLRYEVASYAKAGKECRHNIAYWSGRQYLGIGPAAASMASPALYRRIQEAVNLPDLEDVPSDSRIRFTVSEDARLYSLLVSTGSRLQIESECLTAREAAAEDLMLSMRMVRGVSDELLHEFAQRGLPATAIQSALAQAENLGLVRYSQDSLGWMPTERGWLLGNQLFGLMWDTASC